MNALDYDHNAEPRLIYRHGRKHWRIAGRLLPYVSGGDGTEGGTITIPELDSLVSLDDLRVERARVLDSIRDILATAGERAEGERDLTDDEVTEHGTLVARADSIDERIETAIRHDQTTNADIDYRRRARYTPPMINVMSESVMGGHNLDEALHASAEYVTSGTIARSGVFVPNPSASPVYVDPVTIMRAEENLGVAPRITEFLPDRQGLVRRFQTLVADMSMFGLMLDKSASSIEQGFSVARTHKAYKDKWETILRAMDVDTAAQGLEWVPTGIGASVHEKVRAIGKVAPLFGSVDLPTNPWKWPLEGADATVYRVAEPTADNETPVTASTPGTGAATFDAEIMAGRILFSRSMEADSIVAVMPYVRNKLALAFVTAEETAIINGDSDGTHQDSDIGASTTSAYTLWDGLRKRALANAGFDGANAMLSSTLLRNTRALMGKWGVDPSQLAYIVSVTSYLHLLKDTNLLTVDKMGPSAVILTGQVGAVDGIPVIVSEHVRQDVNASGVYDGITTDETFALIVNRGEWVMGSRMPITIETDDSPYRETFQRLMVAFKRADFQNIGDASTNDDTAILYDLDLDAD